MSTKSKLLAITFLLSSFSLMHSSHALETNKNRYRKIMTMNYEDFSTKEDTSHGAVVTYTLNGKGVDVTITIIDTNAGTNGDMRESFSFKDINDPRFNLLATALGNKYVYYGPNGDAFRAKIEALNTISNETRSQLAFVLQKRFRGKKAISFAINGVLEIGETYKSLQSFTQPQSTAKKKSIAEFSYDVVGMRRPQSGDDSKRNLEQFLAVIMRKDDINPNSSPHSGIISNYITAKVDDHLFPDYSALQAKGDYYYFQVPTMYSVEYIQNCPEFSTNFINSLEKIRKATVENPVRVFFGVNYMNGGESSGECVHDYYLTSGH